MPVANIPLPAPPTRTTGQTEQKDIDQVKVYLDVLRQLIEANLVTLLTSIDDLDPFDLPIGPAGYVVQVYEGPGGGFHHRYVKADASPGPAGYVKLV